MSIDDGLVEFYNYNISNREVEHYSNFTSDCSEMEDFIYVSTANFQNY